MNTTNPPFSHFYMDSDDRNELKEPEPISRRYETEPYYTAHGYEPKDNRHYDTRYESGMPLEAKDSQEMPPRQENEVHDEMKEAHQTSIHQEKEAEIKIDAETQNPVTKHDDTDEHYNNQRFEEQETPQSTLDEKNTLNEAAVENRSETYSDVQEQENVQRTTYETENRHDSTLHQEGKSSDDRVNRHTNEVKQEDETGNHVENNIAFKDEDSPPISHKHYETEEGGDTRLETTANKSDDLDRYDRQVEESRLDSTENKSDHLDRYDRQVDDIRLDSTENKSDHLDRYDTEARYDTDVRYERMYHTDENKGHPHYDIESRYDEKANHSHQKSYETRIESHTDYPVKEKQDTQTHYDERSEKQESEYADEINDIDLTESSPGVRLRHVREQNKWSVKHIADRLFLDVHVIEGLEADNYDGLPPTIFVRGYLRNYAKLLELSPESIMEAFDRLQEQPKTSALTPQKQKKQTSSHDLGPTIITGIVIVTLITLVAWAGLRFYPPNPAFTPSSPELQNQVMNTTPKEETPSLKEWSEQKIESDTTLISQLDTQITHNPTEPPVNVLTPAVVNQATQSNVNLTQPAEPDTPQEVMTPAPDPRKVNLHFKERTWISITDNTGKKLYEGISNSGRVLPLEGTPPFYMKVGNIDGVDIEYLDETKDIKTFPKRRGRKRLYIVGYEQ
jgi:cytoskeleton protein RodZ